MLQLQLHGKVQYATIWHTMAICMLWWSVECGVDSLVVKFTAARRVPALPACACESRPCLVYGVASNVKIVNQLDKLAWGLYCTVCLYRRARAYRIPPCTVQL